MHEREEVVDKSGFKSENRVLRKSNMCAILAMSASAMALTAGLPASAQGDIDGASAEEAETRDVIVVTARRSEERLEDVPVAVSALSPADLKERRVQSEQDLQFATPGLTVRTTVSNNQISFALRGQSVDSFSNTPPAVLAYFNEVQVTRFGASALYDLESIQVLKGPQGTLFGRNATGGALLYQTARPADEFGAGFTAGYGNFDNVEARGYVNIPLGEFGAIRGAAYYRERDGFQTNVVNGQELNGKDFQSYRGSILLTPFEGFENITVAQFTIDDSVGSGLKLTRINQVGEQGPDGSFLNPSVAAVYGPDGAGELPLIQALDFYETRNSEFASHDSDQQIVTNKTTWEANDSLTIKNIYGYHDSRSMDFIDVDGAGLPFLVVGDTFGAAQTEGYTFTTEQWSNETTASGALMDGRLDYILGFFISDERQGQIIPTCGFCDVIGVRSRFSFETFDKTRAVFGQASYALTDRLNLTGGYRHTWEEVGIQFNASSTLPPTVVDTSTKINKPSWTVSLDYKVTDDLLLYFAQRGSFRAGGFNGISSENESPTSAVQVANDYVSETTYDFEIGAKFAGLIGNAPARLNIAAYNQVINDAQRAIYIGIASTTGNVNRARVRGVEVDGNIEISPWFEVGGAMAYTNAVFTDPEADVADFDPVFGPYADTPEWAGSIYAKATHDLSNGAGQLFLRGEFYGQSSFFYTSLANSLTPGTEIAGYNLINLRGGWDNVFGSNFSVAGYVQNLANEEYEVGGLGLGAVIGTTATLPGTPRFYGFEISAEF